MTNPSVVRAGGGAPQPALRDGDNVLIASEISLTATDDQASPRPAIEQMGTLTTFLTGRCSRPTR